MSALGPSGPLVTHNFPQICTRVMALYLHQFCFCSGLFHLKMVPRGEGTLKFDHPAESNFCLCVSDCRSRGREFDPGPVPYFRGD